jgi:hypothetical protein
MKEPSLNSPPPVRISQSVAILIDGNNMELGLHKLTGNAQTMLNFDTLIPKLVVNRSLSRLIYFREGISISSKLADRLQDHYHGSVVPCHKSADIPLSIKATQLAKKVDTIIILSGDADYVELVRHLKFEGVRVEVAAVEHTVAKILKDEADYFIPIDESDSFSFRGSSPNRSNPSGKSAGSSSSNKPSNTRKSSPETKSTPETKSSPETKNSPAAKSNPASKTSSTAKTSTKTPTKRRTSRKKPGSSGTSTKSPAQ